jgi:DNA-binding ferritin-like protein
MQELATQLRCLQLSAHNAHNLVSGPSFFADHEYLGELYPVYEEGYDSVVERLIGLGVPPDVIRLQGDAAGRIRAVAGTEEAFQGLLEMERDLCAHVEELIGHGRDSAGNRLTQGSINLIAGLADESERRQYRIQQRLSSRAVRDKAPTA